MEVRFSGNKAQSDQGKLWEAEVSEPFEVQILRILNLPQHEEMKDEQTNPIKEKIQKIIGDPKY